MRRTKLPLLALVAGGLLVSAASADSIYDTSRSRSMFADRKARAVGDVLTILVTENTVTSQEADSQAKRKLEATASGGNGMIFNMLNLVPKASLGGSTKHEGSGSTSRSSRVLSTITVRITEVTPSGQYVLGGERLIRTGGDTQTFKFHGVVRPEDIQPDNTVASGSVADAKIEVTGRGPIDRHAKPGILSRVFQFLF